MSTALINQQADQQMINENVPKIVKMLVAANQQLSDSGIGPMKNGGLPLYAGRWVDPSSGSLKMFPKPS